jgi:hypothetical protein
VALGVSGRGKARIKLDGKRVSKGPSRIVPLGLARLSCLAKAMTAGWIKLAEASDMLKSRLNQDGTVELSIGGESVSLTAGEMDEQIERLARVRSQMNEPVPHQPPLIETVVFNPEYAIRTDNMTKASLLRLRHGGFGWLNFELPPQEALNMKRTWSDIVYKLGLDTSSEGYDGPERRMPKPH